MRLGLQDPENYDDILQNWTVINDSSCTGLIPPMHCIAGGLQADCLAAKPELAEKFYFHYERQESEQRPAKRAFGSAYSDRIGISVSALAAHRYAQCSFHSSVLEG